MSGDSAGRAGRPESRFGFTLEHWALWQSEAVSSTNAWPSGSVLPANGGLAEVGFLPMLQRRRLSSLARAACAVAWHCRRAAGGDMPAIFHSNHGESQFYLDTLQDMAAGEAVSPSRFSLSVHNAIAGLFSLQSGSFLPYVALAGGTEGIFGAFVEAAGWLQDVRRVMIVCYEQPLPAIYQNYAAACPHIWALAMVLSRPAESGQQLSLSREPLVGQGSYETGQPKLLQAMLNGQQTGCDQLERVRWWWALGHD